MHTRTTDPFVFAETYRDTARQLTGRVAETVRRRFPWSERHLQALWYDARWRPTGLRTHCGEPVEVDFPGRWNLEAGPDFRDAILRIGHSRYRVVTDVEIHVRPADWRAHGHRGDPNFAGVGLHVTWFDQSVPAEELPQGCYQLALEPHVRHDGCFTLDQLDLSAYPYDIELPLTPLREWLAEQPPHRQRAFLEAAGEERLRRKSERFAEHIDTVGPEQALYAGLMEGLGYKQNRLPMRELARRLPVGDLRATSPHPEDRHALLLAVAGLLPERPEDNRLDAPLPVFRGWWDAWWRHQARWQGRMMERGAWRLGATRPANHPGRRLRAISEWLQREENLVQPILRVPSEDPQSLRQVLEWLQVPAPWGPASRLVGRPRAAALLANIVLPFRAACGDSRPFASQVLQQLPAEPVNGLMRQTAHALFGPNHAPSLYRTGLQRQGLMQIFYDYGCGGGSNG